MPIAAIAVAAVVLVSTHGSGGDDTPATITSPTSAESFVVGRRPNGLAATADAAYALSSAKGTVTIVPASGIQITKHVGVGGSAIGVGFGSFW